MARRDTNEYPRIIFEARGRRIVEVYSGAFDFELLRDDAMGEPYWFTKFRTRSFSEDESARQWLHGWALNLSEEMDSE